MNQVTLIGRLGKDPEVATTNSGKQVAKFSLATGAKEQTEWHNIVCWEKTADIVGRYAKKGDQLAVVGRITYRSYEDKDGFKKYTTEIVAERIELLSSKKEDSEPRGAQPANEVSTSPAEVADSPLDDMPF